MIADDEPQVPKLRDTIESLFQRKVKALADLKRLGDLDKLIQDDFHALGGWEPYRLDFRFENHTENRAERYIDRLCWQYLVNLFHLERYMLCTDYDRMLEEIDKFETPTYMIENARAWIGGLKDLINNNVRTLIKKVFAEITEGTYRTGSSYNSPRKKRNNNGVDRRFILQTYDYSSVFVWYNGKPTVTDDLEKVCYILAGRLLPEKTLKAQMLAQKTSTFSNDFFSVDFCQNGNTHYTLSDEVRDKLNLYGPSGAAIGENIKIKVFEKEW